MSEKFGLENPFPANIRAHENSSKSKEFWSIKEKHRKNILPPPESSHTQPLRKKKILNK